MASKGKAPAEASPTRAHVDKKGKKVVQTPPTRASAKLAALKAWTSQTPPPTSSTPTMSQPAVKKPIFIDLTKDSESEGRSKEEIQKGNWQTPFMTGDSSEASCTSHPPPNR
ncbi:hypothetical protein PIB30_082219 [Stylosanthes scabra]|uniref:Uncharacterized protein n=1 Tax=Stylosanthes scabra TaxID=79078 RepID=A0ABU6YPI4_9FABA|nr:hypothetical protein [Stylosanthes scabra]